jgi:hypothetical protein
MGMADYRLYFMDEQGHIRRALEFVCDDDAEAIQRAEQHVDGLDLELWQRDRVVAKLPGQPKQPTSPTRA